MVIHEFNVKNVNALPTKADAVLVIDADAVLPSTIGMQLFKTVTAHV